MNSSEMTIFLEDKVPIKPVPKNREIRGFGPSGSSSSEGRATPVVQPPVQQELELNVRTPDKNALGKPMSQYRQAEAPQKMSPPPRTGGSAPTPRPGGFFGRGDRHGWKSPHRAQISHFKFFELILLLKLDKQLPAKYPRS